MEFYNAPDLPHVPERAFDAESVQDRVGRFTRAMEGEKGFWPGIEDVLKRGGLVLSDSATCIANFNIATVLTRQEYNDTKAFKTPFMGIRTTEVIKRLENYYQQQLQTNVVDEEVLRSIQSTIDLLHEEIAINNFSSVFFVQPDFIASTDLVGTASNPRSARVNVRRADPSFIYPLAEAAGVENFIRQRIESVRRLYGIPGNYSYDPFHAYAKYFDEHQPDNIVRYLDRIGEESKPKSLPLTNLVRERLDDLWGRPHKPTIRKKKTQ